MQKYENGATGITVARLCQMADILDVPVSFFFDGLAGRPRGEALDPPLPELDCRETLELVKVYYRLNQPTIRHRLFDLMKATVLALETGAVPLDDQTGSVRPRLAPFIASSDNRT